MPDEPRDNPAHPSAPTGKEGVPEAFPTKVEPPTAPATGRRPSFRDIRRQLSEDELRQPGVQKLLIEDLERAETECDMLRVYVERYHERDKEVARLAEKLKTNIALEVITDVGLAGGGAIVSLAPWFWKSTARVVATLGVGFLFLIGSTIAKVVGVRK
jgi:hypothetical protein